jgi:hypothetical protein
MDPFPDLIMLHFDNQNAQFNAARPYVWQQRSVTPRTSTRPIGAADQSGYLVDSRSLTLRHRVAHGTMSGQFRGYL